MRALPEPVRGPDELAIAAVDHWIDIDPKRANCQYVQRSRIRVRIGTEDKGASGNARQRFQIPWVAQG